MKKKNIKLLTYKMYVLLLIASVLTSPVKANTMGEKNIHIEDERYMDDANIRIVNSYKVNDIFTMNKIINEIIEYNNKYKVGTWDRSKFSLMMEWIAHNFCYDLGYKRENTADVDFRQSEEKVYTLGLNS